PIYRCGGSPLGRTNRMNVLLRWTIGLVAVFLMGTAFDRTAKTEAPRETAAHACNFSVSVMTWGLPPPTMKDPRPNARHNIPKGNKARIQLDAILDVINEETGARERFVLVAPCRKEWVYAEDRLFQVPSGEYRGIFSLKEERRIDRELTFN